MYSSTLVQIRTILCRAASKLCILMLILIPSCAHYKNWRAGPKPAKVWIDPDHPYQDEARAAMARWKILTQCNLFVEVAYKDQASIKVMHDTTNRLKLTQKETWLGYFDDATGLLVTTKKLSKPLRRLVMLHEFGHALGLEHEENSVMAPNVAKTHKEGGYTDINMRQMTWIRDTCALAERE